MFESRQRLGNFLFTTALGPTQPSIQWVPGALSMGVKRPGREADHSPQSNAVVKECMKLYLHSSNTPSWRCAQLKHRDNFIFTLPWNFVLLPESVAVFWSMKPPRYMVGYQCFGGPCCPSRNFTLKTGAAWSSETSVTCHISTRCNTPEDHDTGLHSKSRCCSDICHEIVSAFCPSFRALYQELN
jgi:hypothetical protein